MAPDVAGSIPVSHPKRLLLTKFFGIRLFVRSSNVVNVAAAKAVLSAGQASSGFSPINRINMPR